MLNPEHLAKLKEGVDAWNAWRVEHPDVRPDLRGANLSRANLNGTDLSRADLSGANLFMADLSGMDLSGANLDGAKLGWANLLAAHLTGADLTNTTIARTIFADVDLSEVKGLESVRHGFPSTIGIDTIYKSKGQIPEAFLRGAGVPDTHITFMRTLSATANAFDFYSCFISYSSKNQDFAQRLHADLQAKGVRVWFAPEDMKIGDKIRQRIEESIRVYDKLLLILSADAVASDWVETEVETAIEKERHAEHTVLFPIRLDQSVMDTPQAWAKHIKRTRHIGDFSHWKDHDAYQHAFDLLLRDLQA